LLVGVLSTLSILYSQIKSIPEDNQYTRFFERCAVGLLLRLNGDIRLITVNRN
jgi:hypothetical protein